MKDFLHNDKVFCPSLSVKPFLAYTKPDSNGIFIKFRGSEYWFTLNGLPSAQHNLNKNSARTIPSLFPANKEYQIKLSELYSEEFELTTDIPIFAANVLQNGVVSNNWVYKDFDGNYDWTDLISDTITLDILRSQDIILKPHTEFLKDVRFCSPERLVPVCVAKDCIDNWCNSI